LGDLRRNTLSWCRRTRISACSAIRDQNRPTTAHQIKLHKSLIATILSRFAGDRHQGWVCGRDNGRQFVLVAIYGAPAKREDNLIAKIKIRSRGTVPEELARKGAQKLISRDAKEEDEFGQNMTNTFPMGDVFVDSNDRGTVNSSIERFMNALFGSNEISPTRDEYAMYLAKSASLRSSDLSRQVGAAIISKTGEVISLGSNEVPRSGGGTYWTGDAADSRDFRQGHDPNDLNKIEIFADIFGRLTEDKRLSSDLLELNEPKEIVETLLSGEDGKKYEKSRVMDLIEFGRIIHAEMSAICDAARCGTAVRDATLFCTVFPCHLCAKHIVASGIKRVVYLEPYPKSYARQLHSDSIQIEDRSDINKVSFEPFIGISPFRYRDLFETGRRKDRHGGQ
jgi:deoxycytidylate deaminase